MNILIFSAYIHIKTYSSLLTALGSNIPGSTAASGVTKKRVSLRFGGRPTLAHKLL